MAKKTFNCDNCQTAKHCIPFYRSGCEKKGWCFDYKPIQKELNKNKVTVTVDKNGLRSDDKETQKQIDKYMESAASDFLKEYGIEGE